MDCGRWGYVLFHISYVRNYYAWGGCFYVRMGFG